MKKLVLVAVGVALFATGCASASADVNPAAEGAQESAAADPDVPTREVRGEPDCVHMEVPVTVQVQDESGEWVDDSEVTKVATADDCVNLVDEIPQDALLPDIQIRNLDKCGKGDQELTGEDCMMILNPAPYEHDFPDIEGKKLLKFPVITLNVGEGPAEVIADRSSQSETEWAAYQTFYRPDGSRESVVTPDVEFYFAGDGHDHWHFTDFDDYWIEDLDGQVIRTAEKHGYCLLDNTTYWGMQDDPATPKEEVYEEATTCGEGFPAAIAIIQGLSVGWGDTYPATLPDQAIDITDVPDGRYRVAIHADALGAIVESNEDNNIASMEITIQGDEVTTHPETATGGLP